MARRAALVLVALALLLPVGSASHIENLDREAPFACSGRDCIPAIHDPRFGDAGWLADDDRVVGVVVGGEPRAYPVRILIWHEIVTDEAAGTPFVVTYCPLCGTALVFDRRVGDDTLTFGVSGRLYRNDLVMYDRESESLWSQVLAESIWGPRHGQFLELMPSTTTTWKEWRAAHPETAVLERPGGPNPQYNHYPYGDYERSEQTLQPVRYPDHRLPGKTWVYGVSVGPERLAFVQSALEENGTAEVRLEAGLVRARWIDGGPRVDIVDARGVSEPIVGVSGFWFAWADFHPTTKLWPSDPANVDPGPPGNPAPGRPTPGLLAPAAFLAAAIAAAFGSAWRRRR